MLSKKIVVSLMSLITILALAFVTPSARAQTFGVSLDTTGDISAASGLQRNHPGNWLTVTIRFDQAVVFNAGNAFVTVYDASGTSIGHPAASAAPATPSQQITLGIPVSGAVARVNVKIAGGIASADPTNDDTSAAFNGDIELLSGNPGGGPTVYEISQVGLAVATTTTAEFKVSIRLSEEPRGGFTQSLINVSGADIRSVETLVPIPETASRPATWRDGLLHGCVVTLATQPGQSTVVISVRSFSGLGGQTYTPPSNPVEGTHILTLGTQRAEIAQSAGFVVDIPAGKRILDYLVIATNIAGSGIQKPNDSDTNPPQAHLRTPAQMRYNVIEVVLPNLGNFLSNAGTIDLVSSDRLMMSEIMSGAPPNSQWIEIKNNSGRQIVTGPNTHRLIFYQAHETPPASRAGVSDRVGAIGVPWAPVGGGRTQPAISMYRVGALDGTVATAWRQSTRPSANFDPNQVGNRIGSPGADPLGATGQPPPATTPQTTPVTTPQTTPVTTPQTPETTGQAAGIAFRFEIVGAAEHSGATVNEELDSPLLVQVVDLYDDGVPNVRVDFRVTAGKGRVTTRGSGNSVSRQTDAGGYARVDFTPTAAGTTTVEVSVRELNETAEFTIRTGTTPATPETTPTPTPGTGTPPSTTVSPVVHVGAAKRLPMLWVSGGGIYALVGANVQRFAPSVDNALNIAVGGGKVYWTEKTGERGGTINSANLNGSSVTELTSIFATPMGIAVDVPNRKLYWTNAAGRIQSANLDGSGITNELQNLPTPMDIALSGGNAYWTQGNGSVRLVNLEGKKTIHNISTGAQTANSLVIADGKIYWTEKTGESAGTINSANLDGTGAKQLISIEVSVPMGIAVDTQRENIYWTDAGGRIQSANLDGSVIQDVAEGLGSPGDMVLNKSITGPAGTSPQTPASKATYDVNGDGRVDDTDARLLSDAIRNGSTDTKYDVNGDGKVNFDDLQLVLDNRNPESYDVNGDGRVDDTDARLLSDAISNGSTDTKYDVNDDGKVNFNDLQLVLGNRNAGTAGAPPIVGTKLSAAQMARLQEQINLLIATGDRSPAAMRTLIYLQQLIATARPEQTQLFANYPNPFNPETWIPYQLATDTNVKITIYNTQGVVIRRLQLGQQSAGYYTDRERAAYWDGRNALGEQVASGVYFYQLETDELSSMRKMVILK